MILSLLIHGKNKNIKSATAIPAISAINAQQSSETVARIASIAVASTVSLTNSRDSSENKELQCIHSNDDRRYCNQCANLTTSGLCLAARRGEIVASRSYHPIDHIPRRCEGYLPKRDNIDKRTGKERWPWLIRK